MTISVFDKFDNAALKEYLDVCSLFCKLDIDHAGKLALNAIRYYKGNKYERKYQRLLYELETRWYASLESNKPDYSIYNDIAYLSDIWACWNVYSRKYLLNINSGKSLAYRDSHNNWSKYKSIVEDIGIIKSVVDLGCGFGYTTAGLKELFTGARVYGTNIKDSTQYKIASYFGNNYGFSLVPDIYSLGTSIDLVFASEYFEHIINATEHLIEIIDILKPKYFITANAFTAKSMGHFYRYKYNGTYYDGKTTSRLFNKVLRTNGYEKVHTNLWNSRPAYWKKK